MIQCFRLMSGSRSATCDISQLSDDTLHGPGFVAGKVCILYDGPSDFGGTIVTANFLHDTHFHSTVLEDFEGESEDHCEYAALFAEEYAIEIARRLERSQAPHVIATQADVERYGDRSAL